MIAISHIEINVLPLCPLTDPSVLDHDVRGCPEVLHDFVQGCPVGAEVRHVEGQDEDVRGGEVVGATDGFNSRDGIFFHFRFDLAVFWGDDRFIQRLSDI